MFFCCDIPTILAFFYIFCLFDSDKRSILFIYNICNIQTWRKLEWHTVRLILIRVFHSDLLYNNDLNCSIVATKKSFTSIFLPITARCYFSISTENIRKPSGCNGLKHQMLRSKGPIYYFWMLFFHWLREFDTI